MPSRAYKPSVFTTMLPHETRVVWFNSVTGMSLSLDRGRHEVLSAMLSRLPAGSGPEDDVLLDLLASQGFLVPADADEYEREHRRFLENRASRDTLYLVVAPTMRCNAACPYCFQSDIRSAPKMSAVVQRRLVDFVAEKAAGARRVGVQWFGGEPLVALPIIERLTAEFRAACDRSGAAYWADMVTNGLELSSEVISRLSRLSLQAMQIPIDGMPTTYAARKGITQARSERLFETLERHMPELLDAVGSLVIRINVDRLNVEEGNAVVRWMKERRLADPRIDFRVALLEDFKALGTCPAGDTCFTTAEFGGVDLAFRQFLVDQGVALYGCPEPRPYACTAHLENAYSVDPQGRIGKCVPEIGRPEGTFGQLDGAPGGPFGNRMIRYADFDPYTSAHCSGCSLLPACQGQCPRQHVVDPDFECSFKRRLAERLALYDRYRAALAARLAA